MINLKVRDVRVTSNQVKFLIDVEVMRLKKTFNVRFDKKVGNYWSIQHNENVFEGGESHGMQEMCTQK